MSSPNLNNIIVGGILLGYICIILLGIDLNFLSNYNSFLVLCKVGTSFLTFLVHFFYTIFYSFSNLSLPPGIESVVNR